MSTCSVLEEALRCAAAEGGDVHVDAAGLDFIDAAGLRVLVETAARLGYGRLLVVHTLAPHLREVVRLVGWDQIPNLTMVEGDPPPAGRID